VSAFVCSFRGLFACVLSWVEILCESTVVKIFTVNLGLELGFSELPTPRGGGRAGCR
jgi:hypothetical protein